MDVVTTSGPGTGQAAVAAFDFNEPTGSDLARVLPTLAALFAGTFDRVVEADLERLEFHGRRLRSVEFISVEI